MVYMYNHIVSAPTKVLYADDDYILFYACYSGDSDDKCKKEYMEVTLSGRSRDISPEKKDAIYDLLEAICVDRDDMTDTQFQGKFYSVFSCV